MSNSKPLSTEDFSLKNIKNYKKTIDTSYNDIQYKYKWLAIEYLHYIIEKKKITTNNLYDKFIIERGLNTISSVFYILLNYSKNVDVAYFHGQKSFYFYVEFIEQISDIQNTFLQLNSRDACLFVYKKTVFEITNDIRKKIDTSCEESNSKMKKLFDFIDKLKHKISTVIYDYDFTKNDCDNFIKQLDNIIKHF
jgi:Asp-tRNA(Asn)/Glu-tRNA(Gln) amidotransferase C subunit